MTAIIATLGPATASKDMLRQLYDAGARIFRCNFAHETKGSVAKIAQYARELQAESGIKIQLLADVEGPGIRTGKTRKAISYKKGQFFAISTNKEKVGRKTLFCDYPSLCSDVQLHGIIKIDAGRFQVRVVEKSETFVRVQALNDYIVGSRRHINLPGVHISLPSFTDKDKQDVLSAIHMGFDYVALSFVRSAADMYELKQFLQSHGGDKIKTIAKIENQEGINALDAIAQASDMLMVARGDLGTELPVEHIPIYQMEIIQSAKLQQKKVIVATEMLESMMTDLTPKRAEVTDIFYAVVGGADYVMLSGETAIGKYPLQTVEMMQKVINSAQKYL